MKRKFTLIEVLGVTILISILAAIGVAAYSYAMESAKESATQALITRLGAAFETLKADGLLPRTRIGNGNTEFLMLVFDPDPANAKGTGDTEGLRYYKKAGSTTQFGDNATDRVKVYKVFAKAMEADSLQRNLNSGNQLVDGWGNPIYVRYPGKFNRGGFDIISAGSDGLFGENEKDTGETPVDDLTKYRDTDNEWLCDDIANF